MSMRSAFIAATTAVSTMIIAPAFASRNHGMESPYYGVRNVIELPTSQESSLEQSPIFCQTADAKEHTLEVHSNVFEPYQNGPNFIAYINNGPMAGNVLEFNRKTEIVRLNDVSVEMELLPLHTNIETNLYSGIADEFTISYYVKQNGEEFYIRLEETANPDSHFSTYANISEGSGHHTASYGNKSVTCWRHVIYPKEEGFLDTYQPPEY